MVQNYEFFYIVLHFIPNFSTIFLLTLNFGITCSPITQNNPDMKSLHIFLILSFLYVSTSCMSSHDRAVSRQTEEDMQQDTVELNEFGIPLSEYETVDGKIRSGEFFSNILGRFGKSNQEIYRISEAIAGTFDIRDLRKGNEYTAFVSKADSTLHYWVYMIDRQSCLVLNLKDTLSAQIVSKKTDVVPRFTDVEIRYSLWQDMVDAGASPLLIMKLSDIYAWTVDFFALQKGDRFKVLYDEIRCEGEVLGISNVRYVEFEHGGDMFAAAMFDQGNGGNVYWNEKGESMRKAFLKAPLNYSRISSGFSYARRHPVTRKVQPHTGIDYAAPSGTPVMTIGDGVVVERQYRGANGNIVKIRHNSVYTSAYLHLKGFAKGLKVGQRVRQGQVIGYVGSTGRSTGPHLDFRIWKNGSPINPLKMESPSAEPLKKENMPAFEAALASYRNEMLSVTASEMLEKYLGATVCR